MNSSAEEPIVTMPPGGTARPCHLCNPIFNTICGMLGLWISSYFAYTLGTYCNYAIHICRSVTYSWAQILAQYPNSNAQLKIKNQNSNYISGAVTWMGTSSAYGQEYVTDCQEVKEDLRRLQYLHDQVSKALPTMEKLATVVNKTIDAMNIKFLPFIIGIIENAEHLDDSTNIPTRE